jgi:hypothetical protein
LARWACSGAADPCRGKYWRACSNSHSSSSKPQVDVEM